MVRYPLRAAQVRPGSVRIGQVGRGSPRFAEFHSVSRRLAKVL